MLKKVSMLMLCGVILLGVCGCGNSEEKQTNNGDKDAKQKEELTSVGTLTKLEENIILVNSNFLVTDNNNIYAVSFDKLFSNDSNYKKLGTDENIKGIDVDDWGYFHILNNKQRTMTCSMEKNCFQLGNSNSAKLANTIELLNGSSLGDYLYVTDNKLFYSKNVYLDLEGVKPKNDILVDNDSMGNEKIIAIYKGQNNYFVKTDKAFYRFKENKIATNKEECEKYADISCTYEYEYKITKENTLTEHYKDIKYIANDKMIFNDNKVYNLN